MPLSSKEFRIGMGFTNQALIKKYYKFTDVTVVNWTRIEQGNERLKDIFTRLNSVVHESIRIADMDAFIESIDETYRILRENQILPRLNNHGRTPDDVYYNWMRGRLVCAYFTKALSIVFGVNEAAVHCIGNDSLDDVNTFSQSPTADLEIEDRGNRFRVEVQSGFTGINDIKRHKVLEARRVYREQGIASFVVHFDLFNGKAALIDISSIQISSEHWVKREQFEDQTVFSIPADAFLWDLVDPPQIYQQLLYSERIL